MNQFIINLVEGSLIIAFSEIVLKGYIRVFKMDDAKGNEHFNQIASKEFYNTIFISLIVANGKGRLRVELEIDGNKHIKYLNVK